MFFRNKIRFVRVIPIYFENKIVLKGELIFSFSTFLSFDCKNNIQQNEKTHAVSVYRLAIIDVVNL